MYCPSFFLFVTLRSISGAVWVVVLLLSPGVLCRAVPPSHEHDETSAVLERLQIAAWLKGEGAKLFKAGDYDKAAQQ